MSSGGAVTLANHMPAKVLDGTAIRVDHYNPEQKLRLALAVKAPHMAEEERFIKDLTTKGSPGFHKFLTQDEWNTRFAPAAEDEQAVADWAESVGLTVTRRYPNRLLVEVEGTAGTIEKAFGVTINNYKVGDEVDFSNDRDPVVPANLSGILHAVLGLNNVERVHRIGARNKTVKGPDYVAGPAFALLGSDRSDGDPSKEPTNQAATAQILGGAASGPTPKDSFPLDCIGATCEANPDNIQSSEGYNYNALQRLSHCCNVHNDSGGSPAVSSIALVGYGGFNLSDVTTFFNFYGMQWNLTWYGVDGSFAPVDGEAPLDIEYSGAMSNSYTDANHTAAIYEYEMADGSYATYAAAFNDIVSDDKAKVVSTSYGSEESVGFFSGSFATGTMHPIFNNMVGTGWTLIAASGDNGASDGCTDATAVDWPSSDPDFLAAGGTQLKLNDAGIYQSEIGWQGEFWTGNPDACGSNHGGSTGGVSVLFTAPWWQNSSGTTIDVVSPYFAYQTISGVTTEWEFTGNTNRMVPDMALTANPDVMGEWYYSTCCGGGGWQDEGGTSIVAPELAGFFAQENTYLNYIGNICGSGGASACTPVGLASPFIYENGAGNTHHDPFYDMLSGCNDNDITVADDLFYFCAAKGFDLVTGWGSANMLQLGWGINWQLIPAYSQPAITFNDKPTTNTWYNTDQEVSWTVTDGLSQGSGTPSGVAGFTQGWDSIPADPYSEPHSGEGNSFYSGPEYSFGTQGCLSFNGGFGCSGNGGAQGCHTVQVEGWDNQGGTAYGSYGPICY
ncbi:MAG: protease pro-enzyme activation domain-containing protein, partial [Terracidiphilus sp.]